MTESDWDKFFELLHRVVGLQAPTWQERADAIRAEAEERDGTGDLQELASYFSDD